MLIVEDDRATRAVVRHTLEKVGWEVVEAENGKLGLERLHERMPDLVLLDLMMPVMDGFQFMEQLRRNDEARAVPVIVLTAKVLTPEEQEFLDSHTQTVIQKGPHDLEDLLTYVRRSVATSSASRT